MGIGLEENKVTQRWQQRPPGSNWGDFGPDDQLGRLNLLTPEKVKQGIAEVRAGLTFCLSLPLDLPGGNKLNPRRYPPQLVDYMRSHGKRKVLFGTNFPMIAPAKALEGLDALGLPEEDVALFLADNARRVFGL